MRKSQRHISWLANFPIDTVKKEYIGTLSGYKNDVVILLEKDIDKVAETFKQKCERRIEREKENIRLAENTIEEQNGLIEMIEEWRTK